jgi:hypothetical protein
MIRTLSEPGEIFLTAWSQQCVEDGHVETIGQQIFGKIGPDETSSTSHQNSFGHSPAPPFRSESYDVRPDRAASELAATAGNSEREEKRSCGTWLT